jgi:hypothetical protein
LRRAECPMEPGARVSEKVVTRKVLLRRICESPAASTEDPMNDDRMAIVELLQKSGDADFLRAVAGGCFRS